MEFNLPPHMRIKVSLTSLPGNSWVWVSLQENRFFFFWKTVMTRSCAPAKVEDTSKYLIQRWIAQQESALRAAEVTGYYQ